MQCNFLFAPAVRHSYLSAAVLCKTFNLLYISANDSAQDCFQEVNLDADFYFIPRRPKCGKQNPKCLFFLFFLLSRSLTGIVITSYTLMESEGCSGISRDVFQPRRYNICAFYLRCVIDTAACLLCSAFGIHGNQDQKPSTLFSLYDLDESFKLPLLCSFEEYVGQIGLAAALAAKSATNEKEPLKVVMQVCILPWEKTWLRAVVLALWLFYFEIFAHSWNNLKEHAATLDWTARLLSPVLVETWNHGNGYWLYVLYLGFAIVCFDCFLPL